MAEPGRRDQSGVLARRERLRRTQRLLSQLGTAGEDRRDVEDRIIELNLGLARELARRYEGRGVTAEDLRQVACLGLVKAVRAYDPAKATDFHSFAVPTIRGELRRWFRDAGWAVRPPRSIQELQSRVMSSQEALTQSLGRAPGPHELARHLGVEVDQVLDALSARGCFAPSSLDGTDLDGDGPSLSERLGSEEAGYASVEARVALGPLVACLTGRERRILAMRFFQGATQAEIGREIGVTQMQVSRLLTAIYAQLRDQLVDPHERRLGRVA